MLPRLPRGSKVSVQVDVDHGPDASLIGGMMVLLDAERSTDIPPDREVDTTRRRVPVTITYRDSLNRHYKTGFEIEYSYVFPSARTFFIEHEIVD